MLDFTAHVYLGLTLLIPQAITESEKLHRPYSRLYPETKWCGPGNRAENYDDLGRDKETDSCCRTHDHCPDYILAGQSKHGLENNTPFTRLTCSCDHGLLTCLHSVGMQEKLKATTVGVEYFNLIGQKCFKFDYPVERCIKYYRLSINHCKEYKYNTTAPKIWEYIDVPFYHVVE